MELQLSHLGFDQLSAQMLYDIIRLRMEVFVVEQNCPYQDLDGRDQASTHVMGHTPDGRLLSYCRVLPPGLAYPSYASIGRVITSGEVRGTGAGKKLMVYAIDLARKLYPGMAVKISAQSYALPFYEALGFIAIGEEYLEDDIPHRAMILNP